MNERPVSRNNERRAEWLERQRSRERQKILGVLLILLLILVITFVRFGKTLPWGAR